VCAKTETRNHFGSAEGATVVCPQYFQNGARNLVLTAASLVQ
jgi:hypothetical protein